MSANAAARGFDPNVFCTARFAPDMLPFVAQIRIAGDSAKGCVARLAGLEPPKYEDDEASFADLRARIAAQREEAALREVLGYGTDAFEMRWRARLRALAGA